MVVDFSLSKSSISHTSLLDPEGPEMQFQLTLLHFHQLPLSHSPPASLPQYKCNYFFAILKEFRLLVVNTDI